MKTTPSAEQNQTTRIERITVALLPNVSEQLEALRRRTGLSKTDLVNRGVTLYEFTDAQIRAGREILLRDPGTGETSQVRFF